MSPVVASGQKWSAGFLLGSYEILAPLGIGGMGEVYRAKDTKLRREVAIKVLPSEFQRDPARLARFEREARIVASLNHPHIAAIYGLEEFGGIRFLVLELVEGLTLAERLRSGHIEIGEALQIGVEVAEALEAAHDKGVIHRDLKPANIKLTADGKVKVLDFGLATAVGESALIAGPDSPTMAAPPTIAGQILGTPAYMSPEQAQGKALDKRTDIWSFGVVLYEILAGKAPFTGDSMAGILASVLRAEPDWSALPAETPQGIRKLLRRCLERDPKQRLRDIGEARIAIETPAREAGPQSTPSRRRLWAVAALSVGLATIAATGWWRATRSAGQPLIRISAELTRSSEVATVFRLDSDTLLAKFRPGTVLALSPDGTRLAVGVRDSDGKIRLATRRLNQRQFTSLPGSEDAGDPFFAPDGEWIAFFAEGKLRKIPVQGGAPVALCDAGNYASGSWGDDGNIVAALNQYGGLSRVPSSGGAPIPVTELDQQKGETMHRWPQVLPGSHEALFTVYTGENPENANIDVLSFKGRERKTLVHGGVMGRYIPTSGGAGYLVYLHRNTLLAAAFDLRKLAVTGSPQLVLDDVRAMSGVDGDFDFSRTGTFVYVSGKGEPARSIFWLDNTGKTQPLRQPPGFYSNLRFSPDGKRLAFVGGEDGGRHDVWVQDLERNTAVRVSTVPDTSNSPVWTPDGNYIVFLSGASYYRVPADGSGEPQRMGDAQNAGIPSSFSPDGRRLAFERGDPFAASDIFTAPIEGGPDHPRLGKPEKFLSAPGFVLPAFSPDGHWLAYTSSETGTNEVYVRPFPGPGGRWQISIDGGRFPVWSPNGRELFFLAFPDRRIMVASYTAKGDSFAAGKPLPWSGKRIVLNAGGGPFPTFDLAPDGKRFAVVLYPDGTDEKQPVRQLTFLLNFTDELRRRVPAGSK